MMISDDGLNFIRRWEKFRSKAYKDVGGVWTYGYGSTRCFDGNPVKECDVTTLENAIGLLALECDGIAAKIGLWIKNDLVQCQHDALISLCYNIGASAFKTSTLLKELNRNRGVKRDYFTRWNKAHIDGKLVAVNGLTNRRNAEYDLFTLGDYDA